MSAPTVLGATVLVGFPSGSTMPGIIRDTHDVESTADIEYVRNEDNGEATALVSNPGQRIVVDGAVTATQTVKKGEAITINSVVYIVEATSTRYGKLATRISITAYKPDALTVSGEASKVEHLRHIAVWWPERRIRVAGCRVRRMTLGHLRVLEAIGSPYIVGGFACGYDAAAALIILNRRWRSARRLVSVTGRMGTIAAPLRAILARDPGTVATIAAVGAYIAAILWTPEVFTPAGSAPSSFPPACGAATKIAIRAARLPLATLSLHPHRSIWDYPVDEVMHLLCCDDEMNGREFAAAEEPTT